MRSCPYLTDASVPFPFSYPSHFPLHYLNVRQPRRRNVHSQSVLTPSNHFSIFTTCNHAMVSLRFPVIPIHHRRLHVYLTSVLPSQLAVSRDTHTFTPTRTSRESPLVNHWPILSRLPTRNESFLLSAVDAQPISANATCRHGDVVRLALFTTRRSWTKIRS